MNADPDMVRYYAARGAELDRVYEKPERQLDLRGVEQVVEGFAAGRELLEVACGTGYWTEFAARRAKSVLATDINEAMLVQARQRLLAHTHVTFAEADVFALAAGGGFSGVMAGFLWSHIRWSALSGLVDALAAALQPGGGVLIFDNTPVPGSSSPVARRDDEGNSIQRRLLDDGRVFEVIKNYPTDAQLISLLSTRFTEITVHSFTYYWAVTARLRGGAGFGVDRSAR